MNHSVTRTRNGNRKTEKRIDLEDVEAKSLNVEAI